jgi:hypothetical protein
MPIAYPSTSAIPLNISRVTVSKAPAETGDTSDDIKDVAIHSGYCINFLNILLHLSERRFYAE